MSVSVTDLWLAILLAGLFCWFASALIHMLIKYHNADYKALPNEEAVSAVLKEASAEPALYTLPHCIDMKAMGEESMQKKFNDGPVAMISIMHNGMPPMGKLLSQQILFFIFGSFLIGYLATISMTHMADTTAVFRQVFVASFLTYGWAQIPYSIWMGQPWSNCLRFLVDALIYAAVTAGTFAWLWPELI
ncbi:hypothetical protein [Aliiglaciecola sp. M165]|uniref:hypothetical protein n=1 Tax=Aliiglaciecola sp. M165 TaxID=2593649 RepID=UPI00117DFEE5|nr:hypothetical protein [Aliiglaciecola sp. M165]TRY29300.1 hypothetical protein FM019_18010 [Aliiglaciecola sp. M165]